MPVKNPPKETAKAVIPEVAFELEATESALVVDFKDKLVALVKAEEEHNTVAISVIEMFEEIRIRMTESGNFVKADIPMKIYDSMRIIIDADEALSDKIASRAKKELLTVTRYFLLGLSIRVRDIRFTMFMKLVELTQLGLISKTQIKNAGKHQEQEKYVKALEALIVKAEYAKLQGTLDLSKIPENLQTAVNNVADMDTLKNLAIMVKLAEKKLA